MFIYGLVALSLVSVNMVLYIWFLEIVGINLAPHYPDHCKKATCFWSVYTMNVHI